MLQSAAGLLQSAAGVLQTAAGVLQSAAGVLQSDAGVLKSDAGVLQNDAGVLQSAAGVLRSAAGVLQSLQEHLYSPSGHIIMNNSISCLPENRKLNYFCLFLKEYSKDKKIKVDKHIFIVLGDILKLIILFPVCQKTGNIIIFAYS